MNVQFTVLLTEAKIVVPRSLISSRICLGGRLNLDPDLDIRTGADHGVVVVARDALGVAAGVPLEGVAVRDRVASHQAGGGAAVALKAVQKEIRVISVPVSKEGNTLKCCET